MIPSLSKYKSIFKLSLLAMISGHHAYALEPLDDTALRAETGQAAFFTSYTAPSGSGTGATPSDYGFFTLGLQGQVSLNANIQHLQLGCGGVNGAGCDIDMSNVSLSGVPGSGSCPTTSVASCDAQLTNPFFDIAIKNPNSLSTRQISGIQFGAQNVNALLQAGQNTSTPNGISTISGYIPVQSSASANTLTGTISTSSLSFPVYNPGSTAANYTINGQLTASAFGVFPAATANFMLTSGTIGIPGFTGLNFTVPGVTVNGTRVTQLSVYPSVSLPNIILGYSPDDNSCGALSNSACNTYGTPSQGANYPSGVGVTYPASGGTTGVQGGPVVATSTACSGLGCGLLAHNGVGDSFNVHMYASVTNVSANATFNQPLGYMHYLPISNSPLALSLQSEKILWPGSPNSSDVAQPGWWMSVSNPVYLGNLTPSAPINLCSDPTNTAVCINPQFAAQFNSYLSKNTLQTSNLGALLSNGTLAIQVGSIALTPIALSLNGVQLSNQATVPNCYGGLKFC